MIAPDANRAPRPTTALGQRSVSRRRAIAAGGAGLVAGFSLPCGSVGAQEATANVRAALEPVLAVENLQAALFGPGLDRFDSAAVEADGWPDDLHADLLAIRNQEEAHLGALSAALSERSGPPPSTASYRPADDLTGFLETAADVENLAVTAYAGAADAVGGRRLRRTLVGIQGVEARHAAFLASLLGRPPFPDAIGASHGRDAVLAAVARYAAPGATEAATPAASPPAADSAPTDPRFRAVLRDAAARLGVAQEEATLVRVEARDWPDASLGCPQPGGFYAQVVTAGSLVVVAGGEELEYHTDERGDFVSC